MRRAIVVAVSCGSGFSVQFSMFPDALACPLRSQVGMPRLSVVIFFLLESALSFRNPETLCEALLGTCAITRQRFLSPIWHKLSVAHLPKFQARMYSTYDEKTLLLVCLTCFVAVVDASVLGTASIASSAPSPAPSGGGACPTTAVTSGWSTSNSGRC